MVEVRPAPCARTHRSRGYHGLDIPLGIFGGAAVDAPDCLHQFKIVAPDSIVCSDGAGCYKKSGKVNNINVVQMNARKKIFVKDKVHHIQNSKSDQARLKDFLYPFKGPATRHLKNYLNWHFWREKWGSGALPEVMLSMALRGA